MTPFLFPVKTRLAAVRRNVWDLDRCPRLSSRSVPASAPVTHADALEPLVLGRMPTGEMAQVATSVQATLQTKGFQVVGLYSPYPQAL